MKRGLSVISHYKFTSVLCIKMHNLGYNLNAKYKHTSPPCLPLSLSHTYNKQSTMDNKNHWCACAAAVRQRAALLSASPVAPPPPGISTSSSLTAWGRRNEGSECVSLRLGPLWIYMNCCIYVTVLDSNSD